MKIKNFMKYFKEDLEIFQNFQVKYFIVHPYVT